MLILFDLSAPVSRRPEIDDLTANESALPLFELRFSVLERA